jgi:hypothetical protein
MVQPDVFIYGLLAASRAGVDGLGQRLADVKAFLQQRIRALAVKQDETIAAQQRMKEHLEVVGRDVEHTRDEVSEVCTPFMWLLYSCSTSRAQW